MGIVGRIKKWGAMRLLRRVHRITHRMPAGRRVVKPGRVLILAPHMDDEVISPGGTLALHKAAGGTVGVVYVSDSAGDPDQTKQASETAIRKVESETCAKAMGFEIVGFLDFPDGSLSRHEPAIAERLRKIIADWKPTEIWAPFPTDHHRDHQAVAASLAAALGDWQGEVWGYEGWSTLWPNAFIDITQVLALKRAGIECHASQLAGMGYVEAALGLNRYRGLKAHVEYAEAFYVADAREYVRLVDQLIGRI